MLLLHSVLVMHFFRPKECIFVLREVEGNSDLSFRFLNCLSEGSLWRRVYQNACKLYLIYLCIECIHLFAFLVYASHPSYMEVVCPCLLQAHAFDFQMIILLKNMNLCHYKRIKKNNFYGNLLAGCNLPFNLTTGLFPSKCLLFLFADFMVCSQDL